MNHTFYCFYNCYVCVKVQIFVDFVRVTRAVKTFQKWKTTSGYGAQVKTRFPPWRKRPTATFWSPS